VTGPFGPRRRQRSLSALVFAAGVGSLAVEICASRLLAPYFGSSTIVWANLIGLVLASLSLGYWVGGRIADRKPEARVLGSIVLFAALLVAATPFVARPFLDVTVEGLDEVSAGAAIGSFFGTLALFAPPVVLLGAVAPFAIRLSLHDVAEAGATAGGLYALSTVGSLLGTFLSALVTIPLVGTQRTLLGSAALLAGSAALLLGRRWLLLAGAVALLVLVPPGAVKPATGLLHEEESRYQFIQVVEREGARRLYLNEGLAVHSLWRPDTVLTGGVWDAFLAVASMLGRPPERVAILGNAGGTTARAFSRFFFTAKVDGVEIDPAVTDVGFRFFGMGDNRNLETHDADARPFLRRTDRRYDLIVVDAYHQPYVPFYLTTQEFFRLARTRLRPTGILALNVATVPNDHRLADGISATLATVFPEVRTWQPLRFNQIVIGFQGSAAPGKRHYHVPDAGIIELVELLDRNLSAPVKPGKDPWTDDRAPVEWITDRMIVSYAARGGRLDEDELPTAP
jgi:spermidine synthase